MSAVVEPCTDCGRPVTREMPEDLRPAFAKLLRSLRPFCVECVDRAEERERTPDRCAERIKRSGIPRTLMGKRLSDDEGNHDALELVRCWLHEDDWMPAPAFWGLPGRGKTHLLAAVCVRVILDYNKPTLFCSARGLLRQLQRFDAEAEATWQRARAIRVLALDDLGAEQATDWRHDQIAELIDERYERGLPTVIATNYPPSMWSDVMDERTASRLRGMVLPVELKGNDRRQP